MTTILDKKHFNFDCLWMFRYSSLVKLLRKKLLDSDMYAGPMPHNQICIMVNMSAGPVAMMAGLLVWCK